MPIWPGASWFSTKHIKVWHLPLITYSFYGKGSFLSFVIKITYRFMEVQQGVSQQINFICMSKKREIIKICSGCGDIENLTFGSESRNYINWW